MPRLSTSLYTLELGGLRHQRSWIKTTTWISAWHEMENIYGLKIFEVGFDTKLEDHDNFKILQPFIYYN